MTGIDSSGDVTLCAEGVTAGYGSAPPVIEQLDLNVPDSGLTVIIGPNGCGKSTLLKTLGRVVHPSAGQVRLAERPLRDYRSKDLARRLALLPQSPVAPERLTVHGLVSRGRYPHHSLLRQWSRVDDEAVEAALTRTDLADSRHRLLSELSGGQRQRAWFAMVLAQDTGIVLLDEPTTFLDIAHQYELLTLCARLHRDGRTIVAVLHDLNQAARYATHLVMMSDGRVVSEGPPRDVLEEARISEVFDLPCSVMPDPHTGTPMVVPRPSSLEHRPDSRGTFLSPMTGTFPSS